MSETLVIVGASLAGGSASLEQLATVRREGGAQIGRSIWVVVASRGAFVGFSRDDVHGLVGMLHKGSEYL